MNSMSYIFQILLANCRRNILVGKPKLSKLKNINLKLKNKNKSIYLEKLKTNKFIMNSTRVKFR